jgi:hypothetical protein
VIPFPFARRTIIVVCFLTAGCGGGGGRASGDASQERKPDPLVECARLWDADVPEGVAGPARAGIIHEASAAFITRHHRSADHGPNQLYEPQDGACVVALAHGPTDPWTYGPGYAGEPVGWHVLLASTRTAVSDAAVNRPNAELQTDGTLTVLTAAEREERSKDAATSDRVFP